MIPEWLKRAVAYVSYYLGLGMPVADIEEKFEGAFGQLSDPQMQAAIDLAEQSQANAEALGQAPLDRTIQDAIGPQTLPGEDVTVTGVVEYERPDGSTGYATVQVVIPAGDYVGDIYAELVDAAYDLVLNNYEINEISHVEITSGVLF